MCRMALFSWMMMAMACSEPASKPGPALGGPPVHAVPVPLEHGPEKGPALRPPAPHTPLERRLAAAGLTEVTPGPGLLIDLVYATEGNFTGRVIYKELHRCFLQPEAAEKLLAAAAALSVKRPEWILRVVDCVRPLSVQRILWAAHPNPAHVANPETGTSSHNHGCAVDLTLAAGQGALEMGTEIDDFSAGRKLTVKEEERLCRTGELSAAACNNRRLLRTVMTGAGFVPYEGEWWHFNGCDRDRFDLIP
ncbi:MAG: peptidase M15D vanX D-ala-D-ala dipeptidase [Deltaproteobacteria bacterium HGW-Deltaproteobacteria-22]|nr:MAG: peptidase M15D vanX D-ala-D-ala dipeptidase [Deltaproteobacteria bacterium HGW-Deltaproteobacteria-22]